MNAIALDNIGTAAHLQRAVATAPSTAPAPASTKDSSTITSSDFLVLLVAELKNQDPTKPTDPTAYVQQLVGVNSLEQLIDLNKQVSSLGGTTVTPSRPKI